MKIVRLKTAVVEGNFDWTFVRVETDEGISGLGECFFAPGLTSILRSLEAVIQGEDPRDIHRLFRKLQLAVSGAGSVAGIVYNAISGIEAALWDLLGQWLEVPMYRLLGGKFRDRIRLYADCHGGEALECLDEVLRSRAASWIAGKLHIPKDYFADSAESPLLPADVRKQAQDMRSRGYTALKFDLDVPGTAGSDSYNRCLSNAAIDRMVELVGAAREAVGVEVDLAVDCHWRYNVSDVLKVARELEPFRLLWLEDPVPPGNVEALRAVSSRANIPVATGENLFVFAGFREILQTHAVGIATPDLQKVGGLSVAFQIGQFADEQTIPIAPHNIRAPSAPLRRHIFVRQFQTFCCWNFTLPMCPSGMIWSMVWKDRSSRTDLFISPKSPAWACSSMRKSRESTRARVSRSFNDAIRMVQAASSGASM
jgi:gluconate/galactonate dehydratase